MAQIEIRHNHSMGLELARKAVDEVARQLQADLKARHHWQGNRLEFDCTGAHGNITVDEAAVNVVVSLSWLLTPARGRIERSIQEYLTRYLKET